MVSQQPHEPLVRRWSKGWLQWLWRPQPLCRPLPQEDKNFSSKHNADKRKDKYEYTSGSHKSKEGFDKEAIKKKFLKKAKAHKRAFLNCLNDLENDSTDSDSSTSSDNESKRKIKDKLSGLCFHANTTKQGFYTMSLGDEVVSGDVEARGDNSEFEVCLLEMRW
jgi:hypothetical protein